MSSVLERNIQALAERRSKEDGEIPWPDRLARAITRFAGSMTFAVLHLIALMAYVLANRGLIPGVRPWDESFSYLGTIASVEAIFLSTFVLITQNRMTKADARRADLDLQISLLAEHEITKLVALTNAITRHLGIATEVDDEVDEIKHDVAPERVLDRIEDATDERQA